MDALFRKLESPVLTDLAIDWPGGPTTWPRQVPDLYAGEPVVVVAELDALAGDVTISGKRGGNAWSASLPLDAGAREPGIGVLWARAKIDALIDALKGGEAETEIRKAVVDVALDPPPRQQVHEPGRGRRDADGPPGTTSLPSALPTNLPEGWSYDAVFGGAQTATPATLHLLAGLALLVIAWLAWRWQATPARIRRGA